MVENLIGNGLAYIGNRNELGLTFFEYVFSRTTVTDEVLGKRITDAMDLGKSYFKKHWGINNW
jgi:hypothetical protein